MPVYFAPPQQRLWKVWVVYRIRRELRLKTHGTAGLIYRPILSAAPGQPVGRIQLHTGRGGVHRHGDAAAVAPQHRRTAQTGPVHAEMVVIAVHQPQLLRRGADITSDSLSCAEVKGRPRHRQRPPRGQAAGRCLQIPLRRQCQRMRHSRTAAVQVEIAVVGQAAQGVGIAFRLVFDPKRLAGQPIRHRHRQRSGIPLLPVRRQTVQPQTVLQRLRRPDIFVKSPHAAVEMVLSVVFRQRICHAVQSEGRSADAVAHLAHCRAEEAVVSLILRQGVIAQHHIQTAEYQPPQRCAVGKHLRCQKLIFQCPAFHGLAERCYAESLTHLPHLCCLLSTGAFQLFALSIVCILPKSKGSDVHKASRTLDGPFAAGEQKGNRPVGGFLFEGR